MDIAYEIRHGSYYLIQKTKPMPAINPDGERILSMCEQLSIAFDPVNGHMWRHGSVESVATWVEQWRAKVIAGEDPLWYVEVLTFPRGYPVDEINKCLANRSYIGVLYKQIMGVGA